MRETYKCRTIPTSSASIFPTSGYAARGDYYEDYKDEQEAVVYEGRRFAEDLGYEPEDLRYSP